MLTVQHLSITHLRDLRPLIQDLSFTLSGSERLAVIGEEGNGKSALLRAICDPSSLESWAHVEGQCLLSHETPGYLSQEMPPAWDDLPVYQLAMESPTLPGLSGSELSDLCRMLSMDPGDPWSSTPFGRLSGGEKVKFRLLTLLSSRPTMLILDEPGNDLDLDALTALESFLTACSLPVLYVSHDEYLLRRTATQVLHLESLQGRSTPRWTWARESYDLYVRTRQRNLEKQEAAWQMETREMKAQAERLQRIENAVAHAQDKISRRDPHGGRLLKKKMKAVKSLEHRLERESEQATEKPLQELSMSVFFSGITPVPQGKSVLRLDLNCLEAGGRSLAAPVHLHLRGSEKVLITGKNGCGKTTLLHLIWNRLQEDGSLRCAFMPQRYEDILDPAMDPVRFLNTDGSKEMLTHIRSTLIAMRFGRDELEHPMSGLSGGQKAKVLLLRLMLARPSVLLADEPTRNLSPLSAPVMRDMILNFPGAVLCVTHDRLLMDTWPGRVLVLTESGLHPRTVLSGPETEPDNAR